MEKEPNTVCGFCGKQFYAPPYYTKRGQYKYCSNECKGNAYRGSSNYNYVGMIEFACFACGSKFYDYAKHIGRRMFCSRACASTGTIGIRKTPSGARRVYVRKNAKPECIFCHKEITGHGKKYCSIRCRADHRKLLPHKTEKRVCEVCGKEFEIKTSELIKGKVRGKACSLSCWGQLVIRLGTMENTPRSHGGKREDLGGKYFRSAWEANYARYLNWLISIGEISSWEFEPDTFEFVGIKKGNRFYTPDFKICNIDGSLEYHEIKGYMDKDSQTKLKRMSKYYPKIKVVLVDKPAYYALSRDVKGFIPNWESDKKHSI